MGDAYILNKLNSEKCEFCENGQSNLGRFGEKYRIRDLVVHYHCVLLSKNALQRGTDEEGVNGFLYADIKRTLKRAKCVSCHYCEKWGAATRCQECRLNFHLPCGIEQGAVSVFKRHFPTYCRKHLPRQVIPVDVLSHAQMQTPPCAICFDLVTIGDDLKALWAPCCRKNWYHRDCLQEMALNMGSLFKCAVCGSKPKFRHWMTRYGIYVPQRDALWESDPSAFEQLEARHCRCDVPQCVSPYGRAADRTGSMWEILLCQSCGSQGTHIRCSSLKFRCTRWECPECCETAAKKSRKQDLKIFRALMANIGDDFYSESVINVVPTDSDSNINVVSTDSDSSINVVSTDSDTDIEVVF